MNSRQAKKIVKKYGMNWVAALYKDGPSKRYFGNCFVIPRRWKDKNVERWLMRRYRWMDFKKDPFIYTKRR